MFELLVFKLYWLGHFPLSVNRLIRREWRHCDNILYIKNGNNLCHWSRNKKTGYGVEEPWKAAVSETEERASVLGQLLAVVRVNCSSEVWNEPTKLGKRQFDQFLKIMRFQPIARLISTNRLPVVAESSIPGSQTVFIKIANDYCQERMP